MKPLAIDLYCGKGGWAHGLIAAGWRVIGYDIADMGGYPGELRIADVLSLTGADLADAELIVASPPCQFFSYTAMPWSRAKKLAAEVRGCFGKLWRELRLFRACFRLQREAIAARGGHHVPLVVENVCGAQSWVGRAAWHFGSFYLWGDVPALMPTPGSRALKRNPDGTDHGPGSWFAVADSRERGKKSQSHCGPILWRDREVPRLTGGTPLERGLKNPITPWSDFGKPGYKAQGFNVEAAKRVKEARGDYGTKNEGGSWFAIAHNTTSGHSRNPVSGIKQGGSGREWFAGDGTIGRTTSSRSNARKQASALIAMIPFDLARWIGECYYPVIGNAVSVRTERALAEEVLG